MIITHNMMAVNAQRQYNIVTGRKAKSTEKLSSGYKINRASDDAAGLAISEKMRRQIRGLTQGVQNTQDGVSLCQVADGALSEVTEILQRMNELSVQAANGTNSDEDRDYIQGEIAQLKNEINRISDTTEFNERLIFQGAGIKVIPAVYDSPRINSFNVSGTPTDTNATTYRINADASGFQINGNSYTWSSFSNGSNSLGDATISAGTYTFTYSNGLTLSLNAESNATIDDAAKLLNGASFSTEIVGSYTTQEIVVENLNFVDCSVSMERYISDALFSFQRDNVSNEDLILFHTGVLGENGKEIEYYSSLSYAYNYSGFGQLDAIDAKPSGKLLFNEKVDPSNLNPDSFILEYRTRDTDVQTLVDAITNSEIIYKYSVISGVIRRTFDFIQNFYVEKKRNQIGLGGYNDSGYKGTLIKPEERIHSQDDSDLWIQSGAEVGDGFMLTIEQMDADLLGLKDTDISTVDGATLAIDTVKIALEKVSSMRSVIGALQNRLEHTIDNENNIIENTTASESKIRDTDMALEMVQIAKDNILEQVGQAMLTQANQSKQGVLSLIGS